MHRRPIQNPQQQEIFRPAMESAVTIQPDVFRHNYETEPDRKEDEEEEYDDDDESMHSREEEDTPRPYVPIQHQMQMPVPLPQGHEKACGNGHEKGPAKSGFNIDQVTLECMMNKNLYKKYLARTDVDKYQQSQVQSRHLSSVRAPVLEMTRQLIDDYVKYGNSKQYTHKIHSAFEAYIDLCMIYVAEHPPGSEHDDVDIMFDPRKMKSSNN
jgi:hypothetical protein